MPTAEPFEGDPSYHDSLRRTRIKSIEDRSGRPRVAPRSSSYELTGTHAKRGGSAKQGRAPSFVPREELSGSGLNERGSQKDPPRFFHTQNLAKKSRGNSVAASGRCEIESFSKRNRVVLKAEIESLSKCPHITDFIGGPAWTRTRNQTVMSGRL